MTLFVVFLEDDPAHADARARYLADHLAFLARNGGAIREAGPLKDAVTGAPAGGIWLAEASDAAAVWALVKSDPFWPTGLRKSVRVLEWTMTHKAAL